VTEAGQNLRLAKEHVLRSTAASTILPGTYTLELQVNSRRFAPAEFHVVEG
jgi:hypothetical protein